MDPGTLEVRSARTDDVYEASGPIYDPETLSATWTLSTHIGDDQIQLTLTNAKDLSNTVLDADWRNPNRTTSSLVSYFPSGNVTATGNGGGVFVFRFTVLPGDFNRDNITDGSDFGIWNANKFTNPSLPPTNYSLVELGDGTGDGNIDGSDFGVWNANKFQDRQTWPGYLPDPRQPAVTIPSAGWLAAYELLLRRHHIYRNGEINPSLTQADWEAFADRLMALLARL